MLTHTEQQAVLNLIGGGFDRELAAASQQLSLDELMAYAEFDEDFYRQLRRAEARSHFPHIVCLNEAVKEPKNWRASQWWLERRRPEVYGNRGPAGVTIAQLRGFVDGIVSVLSGDMRGPDGRRRVIRELDTLMNKLQLSAGPVASPSSDISDREED